MRSGSRRKAYRRAVSWQVVVLAGLERIPGEMVDVSELGAKIVLAREIELVSHVIVVSERFGSLDARVVWRKGNVAGVQFTETEAGEKIAPLLESIKLPARFGQRR